MLYIGFVCSSHHSNVTVAARGPESLNSEIYLQRPLCSTDALKRGGLIFTAEKSGLFFCGTSRGAGRCVCVVIFFVCFDFAPWCSVPAAAIHHTRRKKKREKKQTVRLHLLSFTHRFHQMLYFMDKHTDPLYIFL